MSKKEDFIERWFTTDTSQTHGAYDDEYKAEMQKELDEVITEALVKYAESLLLSIEGEKGKNRTLKIKNSL